MSAIVSSEAVLRLRAARNRMIDRLGLGETYPVRDLPVPNDRLMVPFNGAAEIRVEDSERQVAYALRDKNGVTQGAASVGNGGTLTLPTPAIRDDITFTVHARTPLGREADLLATATVRVGLDRSIDATVISPEGPQPWLIEFGATITVLIPFSQDGVDYRLVRFQGGGPANPEDMAAAAHDDIVSASGTTVRGTGGAIQLPSVALRDDCVVRIRAIKVFDPALGRPPQTNILTVRLPVFVRPDPRLAVTADPAAVVDYRAASFARVAAAAAGVDYRPLVFAVPDAMFAQGANPAPDIIAVPVQGQPDALIRLPPVAETGGLDVPPGFSVGSDWRPGAGADLRLPLPAAEADVLVLVAARKTHHADSGPFFSAVWLTRRIVRLVRPNPAQPVTLTVTLAGGNTDGSLTIAGGQPGAFYTPRVSPAGPPIQPPAYAHQPDPEGLSPSKGVGQLKLGVDFVVARDGQPPLPPVLATGAIPVGTTLAVQAMKAQSRASTDLAAPAVIAPVANVALVAALVDHGGVAHVQVPASGAADRFALYRETVPEDTPEGTPQDGNGQTLDFPSGPLSADTVLVLVATSKDPVQVRRRLRLPVAVAPDPGLTVQARDATVPVGGTTAILVSGSERGVGYQMMVGATKVGAVVPGTSATLSLPVGPITAPTTFSVAATRLNPPAAGVTLTATASVTPKAP